MSVSISPGTGRDVRAGGTAPAPPGSPGGALRSEVGGSAAGLSVATSVGGATWTANRPADAADGPRARWAWIFIATGAAGAWAATLGAGLGGFSQRVHLPSAWLGWARPLANATDRGIAELVCAAGLLAVAVAWGGLLVQARRGNVSLRALLGAGVAWGLPVVLAPPMLSLDAYAEIAQGRLLDTGHNPYRVGPAALGHGPLLAAVDPLWRHSPAPYGPLSLAVQGLAARFTGVSPVAGVIALRLAVVLAVVATGVLVARTVPPRWRSAAVVLAVANPAVLLTVVGAVHLDALMTLGIVASLALAARGHRRWALVCAVAALAVEFPAAVLVAALAFAGASSLPNRARLRRLAGDAVVSLATLAGCSLAVGDGWGWLRNLGTAGSITGGLAPADLLTAAVRWIARTIGHPMYWSTVGDPLRAAFLVAGAGAALWLVLTVDRRGVTETTVLALVVVAVGAPVFYGWYASWALVPAGLLVARGRVARAALVVGGLATLGMLAQLPTFTAIQHGGVLALTVLATCGVATLALRRRSVANRAGDPAANRAGDAAANRAGDAAANRAGDPAGDRPPERTSPHAIVLPAGD